MRTLAGAPILVCAVVLISGCPKSAPVDAPPVETATAPTRVVAPLTAEMQRHWGLTSWLRDAVVDGQLDEVPQAAGLLADHKPHDAVPDWTAHIEQMRVYAKAAEQGETVAAIAAATGKLAGTCGACHQATGAVVPVSASSPPSEGLAAHAHMMRHAWAADAMWEGLVSPNDDRWMAGAEVLAERPLHEDEYFSDWVISPDLASVGVLSHDIGIRARDAVPAERGAIYGELLATCATCHAAIQAP